MSNNEHAHGSAEWADPPYLHNQGYLMNGGITVGHTWQKGDKRGGKFFPIQYNGEQHLITLAPNRTGKGTCAIVPALIDYLGSVLCIDPKGENAYITAKYRSETLGQKVEILDPWDMVASEIGMEKAGFNPLDILDIDSPDLIDDARMLSDAIIVETGGDPHWPTEGKDYITTLILHLVTSPDEKGQRHLGRMREILSLSPEDLQDMILKMEDKGHSLVKAGAQRLRQKSEKEMQSVMSTANGNTHFLDSPSLCACLAKSTFDFADLKNNDNPLTVYMVIPADRLDTHGRWLRLIVSLAVKSMSRTKGIPKRPALFLLDEFAALGRLAEVEKAFGMMAGFGMRIWVILQDLSQLQDLYKTRWQTFIANAGVLQAFGTNDIGTAEYLSKLLGTATETKEQGVNTTSFARSLMTPDEIMRMDNGLGLVFLSQTLPITMRKIPYWEDAKYHLNNGFKTPIYNPLPHHKPSPDKWIYDPVTAKSYNNLEWHITHPIPPVSLIWLIMTWPFRTVWQVLTWPFRKWGKAIALLTILVILPSAVGITGAYVRKCWKLDHANLTNEYWQICLPYDTLIKPLFR